MTGPGRDDRATARWQAVLGLAGPLALALLLPPPGELWSQVRSGPDAVAVLGSAMLLAAGVVVWGLLAWAVLVGTVTLLARAPGGVGRVGRLLLRAILPVAARRIVLVAAGLSLITGAAACGTSAGSLPVHAGTAAVTGVTVIATAPTAVTAMTGTAMTGTATAPTAMTGTATAPTSMTGTAVAPTSMTGTAVAPTSMIPIASAPPAPSTMPTGSTATSPGAGAVGADTSAPPGPAGAAAPVPPEIDLDWPTPDAAAAPDQPTATPPVPSPGPASAPATAPVPGPAPATAPAPVGGAPVPTITVRPGDSLWTIAASHLPAGSTNAQIDQQWRLWYAANRDVIGGDPNLILPGQHLIEPDSRGASS